MHNLGINAGANGVVVTGDQLEVWAAATIANRFLGNLIQLQGGYPWANSCPYVLKGFSRQQTGNSHFANLIVGFNFVFLTHLPKAHGLRVLR